MTLNTQKWIIILICLCLVASSHFISNGCFISEHSVETACTDGRAVSEEMLSYPVDLSQCLPSPNVLEQDIKHLLDRSCWDCLPANISENPKWTHKFPAHTPSNHYLILPTYLMRCCPSVKSFSFVMQKVWFTQVSSQILALNLTMELNVWLATAKQCSVMSAWELCTLQGASWVGLELVTIASSQYWWTLMCTVSAAPGVKPLEQLLAGSFESCSPFWYSSEQDPV